MVIIKLMPGLTHELVSSMFVKTLMQKVAGAGLSLNSLHDCGSARFGVLGTRSKEADKALRPATRVLELDWPSVALKVGVSESLSQLRVDAPSGLPVAEDKLESSSSSLS